MWLKLEDIAQRLGSLGLSLPNPDDSWPESDSFAIWPKSDWAVSNRVIEEGIAQRPASVLIALKVNGDNPEIILTRRADHLRHHAGQVSFPGGRVETGEDYVSTALREAYEEIGLPSELVKPIACLPRYRTRTGYQIAPIIGLLTNDFTPIIDEKEVSELFTLPLSAINPQSSGFRLVERQAPDGQYYHFYQMEWQGQRIWGATAAILVGMGRLLAD